MTDLTDPPAYVPPEPGRAIEDLTAAYTDIDSRQTVERVVVDSYMQLARAFASHRPARARRAVRLRPAAPPPPSKDCS